MEPMPVVSHLQITRTWCAQLMKIDRVLFLLSQEL